MISVIIPTYNEEDQIDALLSYLKEKDKMGHCLEYLVIDGGSTDSTVQIAEKRGATVYETALKSRAKQMNLALKYAKGSVLYFVHADTLPPNDFAEQIVKKFNAGFQAGCFTSVFDWNHPFLRFCNFFSRLPFWFCRGGGQTLYVSSSVFHQTGGFNEEMKIMEEYEFINRVKEKAAFKIIKKNAVTSARDYRINGAFRLQFIYAIVFVMYSLKLPQNKILKFLNKHVVKA